MEIKVTDQVEIKRLVRITVEIPDVSSELYGLLHIAKPGDVGELIMPYKDNTSIIWVNGINMRMNRNQYEFLSMLQPLGEQPHDTITVLHMENLAHEPLFTGEPRLFNFRTIIPATEDDDLTQKWGVPYNCSDSKIEDDDTVTFATTGIPFPIFVALSKMYPDREVRVTVGERLMHNSMKPKETHLIFHDGKMQPYAPDYQKVFYDYPNGVQVGSLVNILKGTIDNLSCYTVQCAETGFVLEVDKENQIITIHPLCGSYTPNPFTAGESFVDADDEDEDDDDELLPDTGGTVGEPVDHRNEYQCIIEDDDDDEEDYPGEIYDKDPDYAIGDN